jgi:streptogramin lyase
LLRFDPASGTLTKIDDPRSPEAIALGNGAVWASELNSVSRIDAATSVVTGTAQIGALDTSATSVAVGEGSVWIAKSSAGQLWRVDPGSTTAGGSTSVGGGIARVAAGERGVWVTRPAAGSVARIDPASGAVVRSIRTGSGAFAVTTGSGLVWVTTVRPGAYRGLPQDS